MLVRRLSVIKSFEFNSNLYNASYKYHLLNHQARVIHTSPVNLADELTKKKKYGKQNTFYFEPSNLLPADQNHPNYEKLYKKIPLVAVFGWTGSTDKNLVKFSELYNQMGYHTIRFSPSTFMTFLQPKEHQKYAEEFLKILKDKYKLSENQVIIHSFSNAGFFIFFINILKIYNSTYIPFDKSFPVDDMNFIGKNTVGVIFDSGVGWQHSFKTLLPGMAHLVGGGKRIISSYLISFFLCSAGSIYRFLPNAYFNKNFKLYGNYDSRKIPTLHIYSKADALIDPEQIRNLIEERKKNNPDMFLKSVVFKDAPHTMIYKSYPDEYIKLIKEHLEVCNDNLQKNKLND